MNKAKSSEVPSTSLLKSSLKTAYFHDCYTVELPTDNRTALELYLSFVAKTPGWIDFLMQLRNKIVALFGLKDMGALSGIDNQKPVQNYRIGDQAGIFKILEINVNEVILGENDKHLDVKISVVKMIKSETTISVAVSTVVHVHNALGRLYMFFVTPAHRIIAPATVSRLT
jgi:hypothetical protein